METKLARKKFDSEESDSCSDPELEEDDQESEEDDEERRGSDHEHVGDAAFVSVSDKKDD